MKNSKLVSLDVWDAEVGVYIGNFSGFMKWAKKSLSAKKFTELRGRTKKDECPDFQGCCYPLDGGGSVIWMPVNTKAILIHEIFHAVVHCLAVKGVPLNGKTEEVYAYTLDCLYRKLFTDLK